MMNLDALPVPSSLRAYAQKADREHDVLEQSISVDPGWWGSHTSGATLAADGAHSSLTRRDVFSLAPAARETAEGALDLLWASLSWGTGRSQRNNGRRVSALADNPTLTEALQRAAELAEADPVAAYDMLRPAGNLVPYLGPPFFTKFLYFAAGDVAGRGSLILDSRVAATLRKNGWDGLTGTYWWPTATYGRYLDLVRRWASELTQADGAALTSDQVELWLFSGSDVDIAGEDAADVPESGPST